MQLHIQIKKEKGQTMLKLKKRKPEMDYQDQSFLTSDNSEYAHRLRRKKDYVPDFVHQYE